MLPALAIKAAIIGFEFRTIKAHTISSMRRLNPNCSLALHSMKILEVVETCEFFYLFRLE
jgi:hypothetical protein